MRASALAGLATLGLSCAGAAQASPAFDAFQTLCVAHRGDAAGTLVAAAAAGWKPVPKALLDQIPLSSDPNEKITDLDGRLLNGPAGVMILLVAKTDHIAKGHAIPAEVCAFGLVNGDTAGLKTEAASFAGVPVTVDPDMKNAAVFVWRGEGARRAPASLATLRPEQSNRDLSLLAVVGQGPVTMVALTVPTK